MNELYLHLILSLSLIVYGLLSRPFGGFDSKPKFSTSAVVLSSLSVVISMLFFAVGWASPERLPEWHQAWMTGLGMDAHFKFSRLGSTLIWLVPSVALLAQVWWSKAKNYHQQGMALVGLGFFQLLVVAENLYLAFLLLAALFVVTTYDSKLQALKHGFALSLAGFGFIAFGLVLLREAFPSEALVFSLGFAAKRGGFDLGLLGFDIPFEMVSGFSILLGFLFLSPLPFQQKGNPSSLDLVLRQVFFAAGLGLFQLRFFAEVFSAAPWFQITFLYGVGFAWAAGSLFLLLRSSTSRMAGLFSSTFFGLYWLSASQQNANSWLSFELLIVSNALLQLGFFMLIDFEFQKLRREKLPFPLLPICLAWGFLFFPLSPFSESLAGLMGGGDRDADWMHVGTALVFGVFGLVLLKCLRPWFESGRDLVFSSRRISLFESGWLLVLGIGFSWVVSRIREPLLAYLNSLGGL